MTSVAQIGVERRLLNYTRAAAYLGISIRSMKELAANGAVPKVPIGSRVLFDREDLDRLVEQLKRGA
jgi:excisionase family DNA binding protein